jgi:RNA polymerase sigma-70 factor (ECF subfamily)
VSGHDFSGFFSQQPRRSFFWTEAGEQGYKGWVLSPGSGRNPAMLKEPPFEELIARVRAGQQDAAAELVRHYEPEIRRAVRVFLTNPRLGRVLDSVDICQSVLANFFVRAAAGQFEIANPEQLLSLLITMARNKLRDQVRKLHAERRDQRRLETRGSAHLDLVADAGANPSQVMAGQELLQELRRRLSSEDRYLAEQWSQGRDWSALAAELGERPDALRKRLRRAIERVARQLGLDEVDHV